MSVVVHSDHKPLESIMKKPLSTAAARLQGMLLRLQKYNISLIYKPGKDLKIADTLSKAQLGETAEEINEEQMKSQNTSQWLAAVKCRATGFSTSLFLTEQICSANLSDRRRSVSRM